LNKLQSDILKKSERCDAAGAPDSKDWIVDCTYQAIAYQPVTCAIAALAAIISGHVTC
jgi:hypothetical protein